MDIEEAKRLREAFANLDTTRIAMTRAKDQYDVAVRAANEAERELEREQNSHRAARHAILDLIDELTVDPGPETNEGTPDPGPVGEHLTGHGLR